MGWPERPLVPFEAAGLVDFEPRPWVANSGWPFGYEALRPFFERAHEILQVPAARNYFNVDAQRDRLAPEFHNGALRTTVFLMTKPLRFGEMDRPSLNGLRTCRSIFTAA